MTVYYIQEPGQPAPATAKDFRNNLEFLFIRSPLFSEKPSYIVNN